jgi:malonyl-CoA O-methyltransferase
MSILKRESCMSFGKRVTWSPADYAKAAALARMVGADMLSRLEWMILKPTVIVDMGCGTGHAMTGLQQRYPEAQIFALDMAESMLGYAAASLAICADGGKLPFKCHSIDLIFANLIFPWCVDSNELLQEWRRVLRPDGLLILTALGLDTLHEWQEVCRDDELPQRLDMHDLGDQLLQAGFSDPVVDVDYYTMTYRDKEQLSMELQASGMWCPRDHVNLAQRLTEVIAAEDNRWSVTYEIIYAHAFSPSIKMEQITNTEGVIRVPLTQLRGWKKE